MDTDIPLYSASFLAPDLLAVAGGGGKGNHGLANKVLILSTANNDLQVAKEYSFADGSDCPMSLATQDHKLIVGVNAEPDKQVHTHLSLFSDELDPISNHGYFDSKEVYQRVTAASDTHIAIIGASNSKSSPLVLIDDDLTEVWGNDLEVDLRDLSFSAKGGRVLAAVEPSKVHFYNTASGNELHVLEVPHGGKFSRGQFLTETKFIAAVQFPAKKRVELYAYEIEDKPMLVNSTKLSVPSVSAMAARDDVIAIGSASGDVNVFNGRLAILHRARGAHKLPVSAVAVSPNGDVASTSVAGTVHLISAPFGKQTLLAGPLAGPLATVGWTSLSVAVLALLVMLIYSRVQRDQIMGAIISPRRDSAANIAAQDN